MDQLFAFYESVVKELEEEENVEKKVNVLVICSRPVTGNDYNKTKNIIEGLLKGKYYNKNINFVYKFINRQATNENRKNDRTIKDDFPTGVPNGEKYDVMWFAGCNLFSWIFNIKTWDKSKEVFKNNLNDNGVLVFTELGKDLMININPDIKINDDNFKTKYTIPIELLFNRNIGIKNFKIFNEFKDIFELNPNTPFYEKKNNCLKPTYSFSLYKENDKENGKEGGVMLDYHNKLINVKKLSTNHVFKQLMFDANYENLINYTTDITYNDRIYLSTDNNDIADIVNDFDNKKFEKPDINLVNKYYTYKKDEYYVDFASANLGGDVLGDHGFVQEEIMFAESSFLYVFASIKKHNHHDITFDVINEPLLVYTTHLIKNIYTDINEAKKIFGKDEKYNDIIKKDNCKNFGVSAYGSCAIEIGEYLKNKEKNKEKIINEMKKVENNIPYYFIAIAANNRKKNNNVEKKYTYEEFSKLLQTAYRGYLLTLKYHESCRSHEKCVIHTGNWGVGAFGHNLGMIYIIQYLALSLAYSKYHDVKLDIKYHYGQNDKKLLNYARSLTDDCENIKDIFEKFNEKLFNSANIIMDKKLYEKK